MIEATQRWKDYECIDAGDGEKIERWKHVTVRRPDPVAIWPKGEDYRWNHNDAHYHRSRSGGGSWEVKNKFKESWTIQYEDLTFKVSLTNFKHTGLFPEQAINWDWMSQKISQSGRSELRILNLFAYTGGATLACARKDEVSEVVHVDAAKGMIAWAKENVELSNLSSKHIRFIIDDAVKFVQREARRGRTYHGIIMDPPSYGRGPNGEMWKIEEQLIPLLEACKEVLDPNPLFILLNSYTTGLSAGVIENVFKQMFVSSMGGQIEVTEIGNRISSRDLTLPCGVSGRWHR